jgi:ubiquinone/menaquinone biosynthesis C-methylase UbiE
MRITYRNHDIKDYWTSRWNDIPSDQSMTNDQIYPLKYAKQIIQDKNGKILEAGCGAGRILRYFHNQNNDIFGIDFIESAITKLKKVDSTLKVEVGNITNLSFKNESFKYILAFGLYHNLEHGLDKSIEETYRVLEPGGSVCASFRADNIQTKIVDWLTERKRKIYKDNKLLKFHKMNLTAKEFRKLFEKAKFKVDSIEPVENMPILYKFSSFRASNHKVFDENLARTEGYQLQWFGKICQYILMKFFPNQFCNIYVLIAHKK